MYDTSFLEYSIAAGRCQVCFHDEGQCFSERKRVEEMLAKAPIRRSSGGGWGLRLMKEKAYGSSEVTAMPWA